MAAQPAQPARFKLHGEPPDVFTRDQTEAEAFKQQFNVYWYINPEHEIMAMPYYHIIQHLSLIKGPLVNDWKEDQIADLGGKTTWAQDPIGQDQKILWTDYLTTFDNMFTDTTKKQTAQSQLKHLRMKDEDLDTYVAKFRHLARDARYDLAALRTANLFALGLRGTFTMPAYTWTTNLKPSLNGSPQQRKNWQNEPNDMPCKNQPIKCRPTMDNHTNDLMATENIYTLMTEQYQWM